MDDNIKSAETSASADSTRKNNYNRNQSKSRNRNYNSANRNNAPDQKSHSSNDVSSKKNERQSNSTFQRSEADNKPASNQNRNHASYNGGQMNNRNKSRNYEKTTRTHDDYVSKPKGYYMTRAKEEKNTDDSLLSVKSTASDLNVNSADVKQTCQTSTSNNKTTSAQKQNSSGLKSGAALNRNNLSAERTGTGKQTKPDQSKPQSGDSVGRKNAAVKPSGGQKSIKSEKQPKAAEIRKNTAVKPSDGQESVKTDRQPKAAVSKKSTAVKPSDSQESIKKDRQPKTAESRKNTAVKPSDGQESVKTDRQPKAAVSKKSTAVKPSDDQESVKTEKKPKTSAVKSVKSEEGNPSSVPISYNKELFKDKTAQKDQVYHSNKNNEDFQDISSKSTSDKADRKITDNSAVSHNRKKSDTRFWTRFFSITAIVPVYTAIVVCMLALPRSTVSNLEKRNLDTFPEFSWDDYWSGTYTASIAHYFDDTVPYRDNLKQAGSRLLNLLGIKYNDVQINGTMEVVNKTPNDTVNPSTTAETKNTANKSKKKTSSSKSTDTEEEAPTPKGQEIADGVYVNGVIVVHQDGHYRAMSMYGGGSGDIYVDSINNFADDLPGVNVYLMVTPTSSEFYTPLNFSDYNASQSDDIDDMNSKLQNATGINVCSTLAKHINEPIYTRTDHHWMSLGAYYACRDFAKAANVPFLDIKEYDKKSVPGYVGTFYSFSGGNADLLNDPEDFIYYVPKKKDYKVKYYDYSYNFLFDGELIVQVADVSEMYSSYISGDAYTVKISTGVKNGRKLCLVKDSYGDAIPPFLTGSFEEIYVVDMRYFELNLVDFVDDQGITDLLFSCCTYSAVGPNADNLENLRLQGGSYQKDKDDEEQNDVSSSEEKSPDDTNASEEIIEGEIEEDVNVEDSHNEDKSKEDDIFDHLNIDDGQVGLIGNINDDFGDVSVDDSGEYEEDYEED